MVDRVASNTVEALVGSGKDLSASRLQKPGVLTAADHVMPEALVYFLTGFPESKTGWQIRELAGLSLSQGKTGWERERTSSPKALLRLKETEKSLVQQANKLKSQLGKEKGSLDALCAAMKALGKLTMSKVPQPEREMMLVAEIAQLAGRIEAANVQKTSLREDHLRSQAEIRPLSKELLSKEKLERAVSAVIHHYSSGMVTPDDILGPCSEQCIDPRLLLVLGLRGSAFGMKGSAAKSKNMCNIGSKDWSFASFAEGNRAVLKALERSGYIHPFCTGPAFAAKGSRFASGDFISMLRSVSRIMDEA